MPSIFPFINSILERYEAHDPSQRFLIGIIGPPASGKSTLADALLPAINTALGDEVATICRMDGYHMTDAKLQQTGRYLWKGCHFTFEAEAYVSKLEELRAFSGSLTCPIYDRARSHDPIPNGQTILSSHHIVITEGNYLLLNIEPWNRIPALLDYCIYIDVNDEEQLARLLERHQKAGRTKQEALAKAQSTDLPNTLMIRDQLERSTRVIDVLV